MSRIDEALRRVAGIAAPEPRSTSSFLTRFAVEDAGKNEPERVSTFNGSAPHFPEETRSAAAPKAAARTATATTASIQPFEISSAHASTAPPRPSAEEPSEFGVDAEANDEGQLVDVRQLAYYALFAAGSLRRHKMMAFAVFCMVFALTAAIAAVLPRTYHVETKLLAQRNAVMTALSNPGRAVPWDADAPTRAAAETVLRRDNLIAIVNQTNLMEEWNRTRAPILKIKDALGNFWRRRKLTGDELLDQLVTLLEARMVVVAGPVGDGTVTIDLLWPNAEMAFRLVESAQQMFLDARQKAETAAINESIGILERYSATLHDDITKTMAELERAQKRPSGGLTRTANASPTRVSVLPSIADVLPPVPTAALGAPAVGADLDDPELPRLRAAVTAKRQEIASLEEARQRQLSEFQTRLSQLTAVYTSTHPAVVALQQNIAALSHDSPQLTSLKAAMDKLESDYNKREASAQELLQEEQLRVEQQREPAAAPQPRPPRPNRESRTASAAPSAEQSPTVNKDLADFTSIRFRLELSQLQSVLERTDGARIELAVSNAAFKYRYTIIRPPQVPKQPVTPNVKMIVIAGLVGGLFLAFAAVVTKDLLSNRILETWQIERQLGLPILAHLNIA
jgi:uncharacterized protein involved in exopolysaccharide biosynthesis